MKSRQRHLEEFRAGRESGTLIMASELNWAMEMVVVGGVGMGTKRGAHGQMAWLHRNEKQGKR